MKGVDYEHRNKASERNSLCLRTVNVDEVRKH
jgi:hypothetical protein